MMVNENEAKGLQTWQNLLDAHYNVELSNERVTGNNSIGYQLDVETITGHSSLVSRLFLLNFLLFILFVKINISEIFFISFYINVVGKFVCLNDLTSYTGKR